MKWTNKKPTKDGFYLYVDQLNTDGKPIVLEAIDITDAGCQSDDPELMELYKETKKLGRYFQAEIADVETGILFQWYAGEVNRDKKAYWSAEPIALPKRKPRKSKKAKIAR